MTAAEPARQVVVPIDQLLVQSIRALDNYFFRAQKEKARKLYKEIAAGGVVEIATLNFKDAAQPPLKLRLALDHSQYKGHITFHMFKLALQQMLKNIASKLNNRKDLNIFTSKDTGEVLIHLPGIIRDRDNVNVMILGLEPVKQTAIVRLQFLDSDQFRKDNPEAEAAAASANDDPSDQQQD